LETRPIVATGEPLLRDRHADTRGNTLAQWSSRGLYARYPMVLRVTWRFAVELSESLDVIERHRGLTEPFVVGVHGTCAAEMERRPEQHRSMTVRKNEAIPVGPDRVLRIKAQDFIPDRIDQWRQCHRRARVSGFGLLHGVNRKSANRINAKLIEFRIG